MRPHSRQERRGPRICLLLLIGLALALARGTLADPSADERYVGSGSPAGICIGVLALRGKDRALGQWQATADYLSSALKGYRFAVAPWTSTSSSRR